MRPGCARCTPPGSPTEPGAKRSAQHLCGLNPGSGGKGWWVFLPRAAQRAPAATGGSGESSWAGAPSRRGPGEAAGRARLPGGSSQWRTGIGGCSSDPELQGGSARAHAAVLVPSTPARFPPGAPRVLHERAQELLFFDSEGWRGWGLEWARLREEAQVGAVGSSWRRGVCGCLPLSVPLQGGDFLYSGWFLK